MINIFVHEILYLYLIIGLVSIPGCGKFKMLTALPNGPLELYQIILSLDILIKTKHFLLSFFAQISSDSAVCVWGGNPSIALLAPFPKTPWAGPRQVGERMLQWVTWQDVW